MTVDLQFQGALNGIVQEILRSEKILESQQTEVMDKIGKAIKKKVEDNLPLSDEHGNGYKHMKRDVKVSVQGKKKKTGTTGVVIHGGKQTAYKWHMLDDGTRNPDGTIHTPALHFTQKALAEAEGEINDIIDQLERRIVQ